MIKKKTRKLMFFITMMLCSVSFLCGCTRTETETETKKIEEICGIQPDDICTMYKYPETYINNWDAYKTFSQGRKEEIEDFFDKQYLECTEKPISETCEVFYLYDENSNLLLQIGQTTDPNVIWIVDDVYRGYYREITGMPSDEEIRDAKKAVEEMESERASQSADIFFNMVERIRSMLWLQIAVSAFVLVCTVMTRWLQLKKAGEKGWKALIPVYGGFKWYSAVNAVGAFALVVPSIVLLAIEVLSGNEIELLNVLIIILLLVARIITSHKESRSFGHGKGYSFGLFFLPVIFNMIIAFGKSEYKDNR